MHNWDNVHYNRRYFKHAYFETMTNLKIIFIEKYISNDFENE